MTRPWFFAVIALLLSTGCAAEPKTFDVARMRSLEPKTVAVVDLLPAPFTAQPTELLFLSGALGGAAAAYFAPIGAGQAIIKEFAPADPSERIRSDLLREFAKAHGFEVRPPILRPDEEGEDFQFRVVDLVLAIKTRQWHLGPTSKHDQDYAVTYEAQMDLLEARHRTPLATSHCSPPVPQGTKLTRAQFLANHAALLNAALLNAEQACLAKFRVALRLPRSPPATPAAIANAPATATPASPAAASTSAPPPPSQPAAPDAAPASAPPSLPTAPTLPPEPRHR